ncbi:FlgB family protein [Defluviimonas sp. WL0024]|uniref:FlgB family protein n=2 Tax=Albidovulum TaxID=205889 RepID=A0ABT3J2X5_9RHOB|nr:MULTISPECIES: FlgB family protein [Defluviimonas]MCU9849459.1 FlgB family protein [Defluviimonas sp. WL0024]MCW3782025.1 FlgB family protein [Defluviimonas salinarum]
MFEKPEILSLAASLAAHAATRQSAIAQNVANADTPGYRPRDVADFAATYRAESAGGLRQTRAGHLGVSEAAERFTLIERVGGGSLSPNGNAVSLETEMVKAADVQREQNLALAIYGKSLAILRASIGRR